jgi:hypothetical protein
MSRRCACCCCAHGHNQRDILGTVHYEANYSGYGVPGQGRNVSGCNECNFRTLPDGIIKIQGLPLICVRAWLQPCRKACKLLIPNELILFSRFWPGQVELLSS